MTAHLNQSWGYRNIVSADGEFLQLWCFNLRIDVENRRPRLIVSRMTSPDHPAGETFLLVCLDGRRTVETNRALKEEELRALLRDADGDDPASMDKRIRTARNWLADR